MMLSLMLAAACICHACSFCIQLRMRRLAVQWSMYQWQGTTA